MRAFWIGFGVAAHLVFAWTVCRLFPFLQGTSRGWFTAGPAPWWFVTDLALAVQFSVLHSWLLLPSTRQRLRAWVPGPQYGCFFCAVTCVSLLLVIEAWQPAAGGGPWHLHGWAATAVRAAFLTTWGALFYSLWLSGLGYQTGFTPWWAWLRGRAERRDWPEPRGAYRVLRHPIYLSFLGLVWITPVMTPDRALLTAVWTAYIFVGSYLKDRRLEHYVGERYRAYQARVPGYPFLPFGPLARLAVPRE